MKTWTLPIILLFFFILIKLPDSQAGDKLARIHLDPSIRQRNRIQIPSQTSALRNASSEGSGQNVAFDEENFEKEEKADAFYDSLKIRAYRNGWLTRRLFEYLYRATRTEKELAGKIRSEAPYREFSGKIVGTILINRTGINKNSANPTSDSSDSTIEKIGDWLHFSTRLGVIKNYVLFKTGDPVDPLLLAENERILRELAFINEAQLQIIPRCGECDTVDVLIVTSDLWTLGVRGRMKDAHSSKISLFEQNLAGWGHSVGGTFKLDYLKPSLGGVETFYQIHNPGGSFVTGTLRWLETRTQKNCELDFQRPFFTPFIKYAGGFKVIWAQEHFFTDQEQRTGDTGFSRFLIQDIWGGHALLLRSSREQLNRTNLICSGRILNKVFSTRPVFALDSLRLFKDSRLALASLTFSKRAYYKSHYIFGFGRTEDVPCGFLAEITSGFDWTLPLQRLYAGLKITRGDFLPKSWGYLYGSLGVGGFTRQNKMEEGVLSFQSSYFSSLYFIKKYRLRHFCRLNYTRGFRRPLEEQIGLNSRTGLRQLTNFLLQGTERLTLETETLVFAPVDFYSFKIAGFGFTDLAWLGKQQQNLLVETPILSFGLGVRLRNERLVFNTLQITFGYFPNVPAGFSQTAFRFSGEQVRRFTDFETGAPEMVGFE